MRALLATAAPGSGATGPERDTARRMADRLSAEHGLDSEEPAEFTLEYLSLMAGAFRFEFDDGRFRIRP
ncbi:MAG: hypothetical protein V4510_10145 [bacterium]